jgi:hypothetical protein
LRVGHHSDDRPLGRAPTGQVPGAVWLFFWAVGSGQFDDLDTPALRVVMDDDEKPPEEKTE